MIIYYSQLKLRVGLKSRTSILRRTRFQKWELELLSRVPDEKISLKQTF